MCDQQFTSKGDLTAHTRGHADNKPAQINCSMCGWPFEDSLSLEDHKIKSGHDKPRFTCENCGQGFVTPRSLEAHKKPPYGCSPVLTGVASKPAAKAPAPTSVTCDRCGKTFKNRQEHDSHRSFSNDGPCADHNHKSPPKNRVVYKDPDAPNNNPVGEILGYASSDGEGAVAGNTATAPSDLSADDIWCAQCRTRFKSYAQHVNHTLWCVTKHGPTEEAAPSQVSARSTSEAIQPPVLPEVVVGVLEEEVVVAKVDDLRYPRLLEQASTSLLLLSLRSPPMQVLRQGESSVRHVGGVFEMEQAKHIQGKILRLLIQSDIFIRNDGKMGVCGIEWTRIGVEKQPDVPGMFEGMCHLPKILQGEYLPPPNTFKSDYQLQYPASEFEAAPARDRNKPGLGVVAIACSKVVLADGLQEVVKIAAVDVVTCRILMNHLICNNGTARVKNWRSDETGLYSWDDMEQARKLGYKIFKGWCAARSALSKFIDKDTIILGHDLRSDLDCLRMIHGRAVDIAKVAEKAAKGPLSKPQLSLDSLCRDFNGVVLKSDPEYGRDMLMNAFAVREMGLWLLKNKEEFEKKIRQKSSDYQRIMPRTAAA
ncbi:hypothetical protein SNOG_07576 [Parastagonospora nodorum SN15]|uniref:C2H2-type domain-containing protein n=1 Tax=Phaeosphaeria nodorum (strain SN15 / ATCC MYA-4574 / FGSC 10173) TaxID=321614 RepID=Q0UKY8_PHANO|nr:hypothetical protein SNOG_07576 [Parastagonospora nodorum SN15]EAT85042.2 hypothetical protein SNOG_07576 [Parastagonospora nodorum SN15]